MWKAIIRRKGWPHVSKTFRMKRDAKDWARTVEDEIRRGIYFHRSGSEKITISDALDRYLREVTLTRKPLLKTVIRTERDSSNQALTSTALPH